MFEEVCEGLGNVWVVFWWCFFDVLGMFWRCLRGVWEVSLRCLGGVWEVFGRCLGGVWEVFGRCLGGVWEVKYIRDPKIKIYKGPVDKNTWFYTTSGGVSLGRAPYVFPASWYSTVHFNTGNGHNLAQFWPQQKSWNIDFYSSESPRATSKPGGIGATRPGPSFGHCLRVARGDSDE
jgi:hypothetical protein